MHTTLHTYHASMLLQADFALTYTALRVQSTLGSYKFIHYTEHSKHYAALATYSVLQVPSAVTNFAYSLLREVGDTMPCGGLSWPRYKERIEQACLSDCFAGGSPAGFELYHLNQDPWEIHNIYSSASKVRG